MKLADQVRRAYERRPYPSGDAGELPRAPWTHSFKWMEAFGREGAPLPAAARILIAGCGDGTEAAWIGRRLPAADLVAVDFSARSVAVARRRQRSRPAGRPIRFEVADLTDARLPGRLGDPFDLIICHGVLSYIPQIDRALRTLHRCLRPDGVLYLGVNGSAHVSTRLRPFLAALGCDIGRFEDTPEIRETLRRGEPLLAGGGRHRISLLPASYLAGDIFGPLNHCLPLGEWVRRAAGAGLAFRASWASVEFVRHLSAGDLYARLLPRSRTEVAELLDQLHPGQFHVLLFSPAPADDPPWADRRALLTWRVALNPLYSFRPPARGPVVRDRVRSLTIGSGDLKLSTAWQMPEWELELLRQGRGRRAVGEVLRELPLRVPFSDLRTQLYLLHQLGIIALRPPARP